MTTPVQRRCPFCGQPNYLAPKLVGQPVRCVMCGQTIPAVGESVEQFTIPDQRRTNGWAVASLVCGILFCFPLASLLAIIFGIIGLAKTSRPATPGKTMSIIGTVLGCVSIIVQVTVFVPAFKRAMIVAGRAIPAAQLKRIGLNCEQYADTNKGVYPPDLGTLAKVQDMRAIAFVDPRQGILPPDDLSGDELAGWVNANTSYVYAGAHLNSNASVTAVIAYQKEDNHPDGILLLFPHERVEFEKLDVAEQMIEQSSGTGK